MNAVEAAAEVMRLAREYRALPDYAPTQDVERPYSALHTAVRALAERAYPSPEVDAGRAIADQRAAAVRR